MSTRSPDEKEERSVVEWKQGRREQEGSHPLPLCCNQAMILLRDTKGSRSSANDRHWHVSMDARY